MTFLEIVHCSAMTQIIADPTKTINKGDSKELHVNEKERMVSVASQESN